MCGLAGIIDLEGRSADPEILGAMAESLNHRGPDDRGEFYDGQVGLALRRLAIIDLEHGHQPMTSDGATIVLNGEIYNYVELREELKSRGHRFRTTSDTEVVLRMYLEYGTDAIRRLNGMFAFLLYDPARGRVVAARDHFGIKPLYYTRAAGQLLFASEIKALLRHPAVRAEADDEALQEYFTFQLVLDDRTMFRNVHKVRPGNYQVIDLSSGTSRATCFWEPRFDVDTSHTESWFTERLRHLLDDSVRLQLRSDVPVGAYLSGGTDSSLITTLASKHLGRPLDVFTGAFQEGPRFDESPYARMVAESTGARLHMVHPTADQVLEVLPALVRSMDEPAAGPG
ncbi:MAG: asparagine synthase (glutamine-hydrolyzing), partial [Gemmatimonadales bacterium]